MKVPALLIACFVFLQETYGAPQSSGLKGHGYASPYYPSAQYSNPKQDVETITRRYTSNLNFYPQTNLSRPNYGFNNPSSLTPSYNPANQYNLRLSDARNINNALHGSAEGTINYNAIINTLAYRSYIERMDIASVYETTYKVNLIKEFEEKLSGSFKDLVIAIMTSPLQYYAKALHDAMDGPGTDEACLIDILCTLGNPELKSVERIYEQTYGVKLQTSLEEDTSSHFKYLLLSLLTATRDENPVLNKPQASSDAHKLLEAGKLKWGTDEEVFITIFAHRSYRQLRQIADDYEHIAGHTLDKAIEDEFSGHIREGLLAILHFARNPSYFFSERLHESLSGLATDDKQLIRIVTIRREVDMELIKMNYKTTFGKTLQDDLVDSTSDEFKDGLLALIGHSRY